MKRTVADVAAAVGVHRVTVHRWFQHDRRARRRMVHARRRRTLNRELLRGLAALYRVPVPVLTERLLSGEPLRPMVLGTTRRAPMP